MDKFKEKERTIEELALFVKNKSDEKQSLYCMLLGAGASKSSGIRTGQELVNGWRDLFCEKIIKDLPNKLNNMTIDEKKKLLAKILIGTRQKMNIALFLKKFTICLIKEEIL